MQKDYHYYVIYALAKEAGYSDNDAYVIAYSSQFVDDNTDREYMASDSHGEFHIPFPDKIGRSGDHYFPIITQAVDITSFLLSVQRYVYAPFHFIPGDNNVEIKRQKNPLCTTRGCNNAQHLINEALRDKTDLYRLGIALHTYADTWSHERFSAFYEDWNKVFKGVKGIPPNIGHGELIHDPDIISKTWTDKRFGEKIDNSERALIASEGIFTLINKGKTKWSDIRSQFESIMNAANLDKRIKLIRDIYPNINEYNENEWLNEALDITRDKSEIPEFDPTKGNPLPPHVRFPTISVKDLNSHWFRFQTATKKQLAAVIGMIDAL
jgi:hypothetical protein